MLIFGAYEGQRLTLEVPVGMTVKALKEDIQERLGISVDQYKQDKKVLVLSYAGADLGDSWVFTDLGIVPGTTIRVQLKEEVKPVLYIKCSHSQDTISIYGDITITHMKLDEVRSMASMKSGLPVGIFRLTTTDGQEMFDSFRLEDYSVDVGHTILLENWDGWNEFLNLAIMGFTPQVLSQIGGEEIVARYQTKVALFIAAHCGHVDLARAMLRQGARCDEPTGYHPARMWCKEDGHIDSLKCPVHEATLNGQLGVLRLFVNHDITCLKAKDGFDLEPLNIALRKQIKNCASFLLTKQWSKVNITKHFALHLATYTRLKKWCERAKERALLKYGHSKSTLKRRNFHTGPLVSHGILVDGFSRSQMTGKPKALLQKEEKENREKEKRRPKFTVPIGEVMGSTEEPESYFKNVNASQSMKALQGQGRLPPKWGKLVLGSRVKGQGDETARETGDAKKAVTVRSPLEGATPEPSKPHAPPSNPAEESEASDDVTRLPPILNRFRNRILSQSQPNVGTSLNAKDNKPEPTPRAAKTDRDKPDGTNNNKSGMSRLVKSKGAFFMSSSSNPTQQQARAGALPTQLGGLSSVQQSSQQAPMSERSDKSKVEPSVSVMSDRSAETARYKTQTAASVTSASSNTDDVQTEEEKKQTRGRKKRRNRVSSALLLSKAKSSEGAIPLPLISHEQDRRPFFYHQGMREDDIVDSTLDLVSKYRGYSSRERAIKSLTVANSFSDKPWLGQVRLALNLTSNSLKRNVRRLQPKQRNFAHK
ncbi:uncharacterized protein LOC101845019 [Aplysia californica]|uniref:Uncharacterized protein LOC101845019 n=1 Tax=Aplysia californica TaxID=6500 RepID=A0ABM1A4U1_APLCA|nr:uncharacterized protein LOC101845019 [Aplysia californica]